MRVLGDVWLLASIVLTVAAAVLLAAVVLPAQHRAMALLDGEPGDGTASVSAVERWVSGARRLSMSSGIFALLWAVVVVLMVVRPGSTTGGGAAEPPDLRWMAVVSVVETVSLVVLLANLATVHVPQVASVLGPVHGFAYLATIARRSCSRSTPGHGSSPSSRRSAGCWP